MQSGIRTRKNTAGDLVGTLAFDVCDRPGLSHVWWACRLAKKHAASRPLAPDVSPNLTVLPLTRLKKPSMYRYTPIWEQCPLLYVTTCLTATKQVTYRPNSAYAYNHVYPGFPCREQCLYLTWSCWRRHAYLGLLSLQRPSACKVSKLLNWPIQDFLPLLHKPQHLSLTAADARCITSDQSLIRSRMK